MLMIGSHLSSAKGFLHMGREAVRIGANTFQFLPGIPGEQSKKNWIFRMWQRFWPMRKAPE